MAVLVLQTIWKDTYKTPREHIVKTHLSRSFSEENIARYNLSTKHITPEFGTKVCELAAKFRVRKGIDMSRGREWFASGGRHLEKNPHTNTFVEFKSIMAKLDAQLSKEAQERKERKEAKKNG